MKQIPLNLMTLYADLVQRQDANALPAATISRRLEGGKRRLYASIRDGVTRRQVYIGTEGDPEVAEKVAAYRRAAAGTRDLRKTVTALKAAGVPVVYENYENVHGFFGNGTPMGNQAMQQACDFLIERLNS